jgi:hypothetical protein
MIAGPCGAARSSSLCALLALSACVLAACAPLHSQPPPKPERSRPVAVHTEDFPDISLLPLRGYEMDPAFDQLAMSLAGGTVRRYEISMIQRNPLPDDPPEAVLSRFAIELAPLGWRQEDRAHWVNGRERLFIEAGRSGRLTTVRFHLRPLPEDGASGH